MNLDLARQRSASLAWQAAAEDLRTLAWLHAAERDAATWLALHEHGFPLGLTLAPAARSGVAMMNTALAALRQQVQSDATRADDALAADFAAIHLTHALRASPCESVWLDEDHLMLQGPTFAVREAYRAHGLAVADWRHLPDDHLSHQLGFLAHLIGHGEVGAARDFAGQHLQRWLPAFAERVARGAETAVYAALATLTAEAVQALRERWAQAADRSDSCTQEPAG